MNFWDAVALAAVVVLTALGFRSARKKRKGGCGSCCGSCGQACCRKERG